MPKRIEIDEQVLAKVESQCPKYLSPTGFINFLIEQSLDNGFMLGKPSAAQAAEPGRGEGFTSKAVSSSTTKKTKNSSIKSIPPSLQAHDDLIGAFWKTKAGSKSEAGWKLLMTELQKIQEKYGDRVVRDQLELAAASRWKGVSLRNYEQFGLNTPGQPQRRSETDWDAIEAAMPKTPW